jgi:hypothetical protein
MDTTYISARFKINCHSATGSESEEAIGRPDYGTDEIQPIEANHEQSVASCRVPNAIVNLLEQKHSQHNSRDYLSTEEKLQSKSVCGQRE